MEKMVNAEFFDALEQLEKEKGIPVDYMLDRVVSLFATWIVIFRMRSTL